MKIRLLIINSVCILGTLWAQEKTFYLKSGDKVTGTITAETDSTYGIETTVGSVTINKNEVNLAATGEVQSLWNKKSSPDFDNLIEFDAKVIEEIDKVNKN